MLNPSYKPLNGCGHRLVLVAVPHFTVIWPIHRFTTPVVHRASTPLGFTVIWEANAVDPADPCSACLTQVPTATALIESHVKMITLEELKSSLHSQNWSKLKVNEDMSIRPAGTRPRDLQSSQFDRIKNRIAPTNNNKTPYCSVW